ncbi:hypothetical protein R1sor_025209 [Riccia sorocarpa]|uniref:S-adenosylmethionine-dependent methyltransferase At5g38100 n=1 Tax=Riccia sorocarpa TaxID=122646 RepID=A0ABD3G9B6_9MARC
MNEVRTPNATSPHVIPETWAMTGGEGENSYTKNSSAQQKMTSKIWPLYFDAIKILNLPSSKEVLRIVDFGCGSALNCIVNVEVIIEYVLKRYAEERKERPDIQVYFQDVPTNDFNTLFKHIFSTPNDKILGDEPKNYMVAAIPGSFLNRNYLLPKSTVNVAVSTHALHWLSKFPDVVRDRMSPAYNGGHTSLFNSSLATVQACAKEAEEELDHFLAARASEVVQGGLVFLTFLVRQGGFYPYKADPVYHIQEDVWNELVLEGVTTEELRDDFNFPIYCRSLDEVHKVLERYSYVFEVQKEESMVSNYFVDPLENPEGSAQYITAVYKGVSLDFHESYFGKTVTSLFFQRLEQGLYDIFSRWKLGSPVPEHLQPMWTNAYTVFLRRK